MIVHNHLNKRFGKVSNRFNQNSNQSSEKKNEEKINIRMLWKKMQDFLKLSDNFESENPLFCWILICYSQKYFDFYVDYEVFQLAKRKSGESQNTYRIEISFANFIACGWKCCDIAEMVLSIVCECQFSERIDRQTAKKIEREKDNALHIQYKRTLKISPNP